MDFLSGKLKKRNSIKDMTPREQRVTRRNQKIHSVKYRNKNSMNNINNSHRIGTVTPTLNKIINLLNSTSNSIPITPMQSEI